MAAKIHVKLIAKLEGHKQAIYALCMGPGQTLISAGGDGLIVQWNFPSSPDGVVLAQVPEPVYSLHYLTQLELYCAGTQSGKLYVIRRNGTVRNFLAHESGLFGFLALESGFFITTGGDGMAVLWNTEFEIVLKKKVSDKAVRTVLELGQNRFAFGSSDNDIYITNEKFESVATLEGHKNSVFALAFDKPNEVLYSGGRDATIKVWDLNTNLPVQNVDAHLLHIHALVLNPAINLLASASMDKTIKLWNPQTMELLKVLDFNKFGLHGSSVNAVLWLSDNVFASCSDDRMVGIWKIEPN